jgi:MGT family glycosyltransferase
VTRYLFVVPPLAGHVNPAAGVAAELRRRGHEVAWVAHETVVGELLGDEARIYPAGDGFLDEIVEHLPERERLRGPASLTFLWERVLVPLARHMADPVRSAVADFRPDVVVADQQAFAGGIVATELGVVWAASATTTADLGSPPTLLPKIGEWMRRQIDELCREVGVEHLAKDGFDPRFSPDLVLVYSSRALVGESADEALPLAFVGPVLRPPLTSTPFPWEWLDDHDVNVLVSLGTVSGDVGGKFLHRAIEAADGRPRGVIVVGPPELQTGAPDNVLVCERVPQLELLPHLAAVVCHAGHNTTVEALAESVPLVCAPIRDDQPVVASQVVQAGAGVRINFGRARPDDIAGAVDTVLGDASYRTAAAQIAASFESAGGAPAAAEHLQKMSNNPTPY